MKTSKKEVEFQTGQDEVIFDPPMPHSAERPARVTSRASPVIVPVVKAEDMNGQGRKALVSSLTVSLRQLLTSPAPTTTAEDTVGCTTTDDTTARNMAPQFDALWQSPGCAPADVDVVDGARNPIGDAGDVDYENAEYVGLRMSEAYASGIDHDGSCGCCVHEEEEAPREETTPKLTEEEITHRMSNCLCHA